MIAQQLMDAPVSMNYLIANRYYSSNFLHVIQFILNCVHKHISMTFQSKSDQKNSKTQFQQNLEDIQRCYLKINSSSPMQMFPEIAFDRSNPLQTFYREVEKMTESQRIIKLGWKVVSLQRDQQDLGLFCFGMLQAQIKFPLKIYTITQEAVTNNNIPCLQGLKQVWMEAHVMLSQGLSEQQSSFELKVFRLCQSLLPLLRNFVDKYLNWSYMSTAEFEDTKVIKLFQKEVIFSITNKINICEELKQKKKA